MMRTGSLKIVLALTACAAMLSGCVMGPEVYKPPRPDSMEPSPTRSKQYSFLDKNKFIALGDPSKLYAGSSDSSTTFKLSAFLTGPANTIIKFENSFSEYAIPDVDSRPLALKEGVYPFEITPFPTENAGIPKNAHLSGALVVFNLDNTVELATFGKNEQTKMFKPEMIEKALNGTLTEGVINIDEKPLIVYWIGNRKTLYIGGDPIVELDFSKNPDITELKVNGTVYKDFIATVPIYKEGQKEQKVKRDSDFVMKYKNGKAFKGYIRNVEDNATTAFVKIPCAFPQNLLDAAAKGTISKLKIFAEGNQDETIAEIVFGVSN